MKGEGAQRIIFFPDWYFPNIQIRLCRVLWRPWRNVKCKLEDVKQAIINWISREVEADGGMGGLVVPSNYWRPWDLLEFKFNY